MSRTELPGVIGPDDSGDLERRRRRARITAAAVAAAAVAVYVVFVASAVLK